MTSEASRVLVRLRGVSKRFADRLALDAVDLEVRAGLVLAVVGPSGSGKTTLLNVLLGWEAPDGGEVERDPSVGPGEDGLLPWASVAVVPQQRGLLPDLTLGENVLLPLRLAGRADRERAARALDRLHVGHLARRYPDQVSLGEQQRASIARALVLEPALVLADEPTAHQDAASARVVLAGLRGAADAGAACVVVTHDAAVVDHADEVVEAAAGTFAGRLPPRR